MPRGSQIATQSRIGMSVCSSTKAGISAVIKATVIQVEVSDKGPDISVVPIDDRMDAHKVGPAVIGWIEVSQLLTMRVSSPCTDKDSLDIGVHGQVVLETRPDSGIGWMSGVFGHGKMIYTR